MIAVDSMQKDRATILAEERTNLALHFARSSRQKEP